MCTRQAIPALTAAFLALATLTGCGASIKDDYTPANDGTPICDGKNWAYDGSVKYCRLPFRLDGLGMALMAPKATIAPVAEKYPLPPALPRKSKIQNTKPLRLMPQG